MWQPTKPISGDIKSVSQGDIQGNFLALDDIYNGKNNFIKFTEQSADPSTIATQMALYTKHVGTTTAMFLRNENNGTVVDFTTATKAATGSCTLPCGIKFQWGVGSLGANVSSGSVSYLSSFTACYGFWITVKQPSSVGDARDYGLRCGTPGLASCAIYRDTTYKGTIADFYWFAIGV